MTKEMKDSGVEWIGEVPGEWETDKISQLFKQRIKKVSDYDFEPLSVTKQGIVLQLDSAAKSSDHSNRKLVNKGDFVINSRSDRKMSAGLSNLDGSVSLINTVLKFNDDKLVPKYVGYLLKNYGFAEEFYRWGTGIVADLWSTNWERMKKIVVPIPPSLEQQQKIADFLNEKIAIIDGIITDTKQSIEELQKFKQSAITEAVTKGLDSNVKMKDSGIKWIGEIPEKWSKSKVKQIVSTKITDGPHETPKLVEDGIPFVSAEAVKDGIINLNYKRGFISDSDHQKFSKKVSPQKNDIFMVKSGATTGNIGIVKTDEIFDIWSPLALIRPNTMRINTMFLYYYLQSDLFRKQVELNWSFGTQQNIGMGVIEQLFVFFPSVIEQQKIADYLDEKTASINRIITEKGSIITEYEAYKKSLIYEYVTGKKEVPHD